MGGHTKVTWIPRDDPGGASDSGEHSEPLVPENAEMGKRLKIQQGSRVMPNAPKFNNFRLYSAPRMKSEDVRYAPTGHRLTKL
jgi:hypothetical protein